jgi:hypothetical protein
MRPTNVRRKHTLGDMTCSGKDKRVSIAICLQRRPLISRERHTCRHDTKPPLQFLLDPKNVLIVGTLDVDGTRLPARLNLPPM